MEERKVLIDAYQKYRGELQASNGCRAAELSGGNWKDGCLSLCYLNQSVSVYWPDMTIDPEPATLTEKILLFKYLLDATGIIGPSQQYIAYLQLPQGGHHQPAFRAEVTEPLARRFGSDLPAFAAASERLGAIPICGGDMAYQFALFPKISLRVIIWEGDEEFPPRATVLYDSKCHFHLDTDALGTAGEILAARLLEG